jgi:hypothetical protein
MDRETPGRLIFFERRGFYAAAVHLGDRDGPRRRIDLPLDAEFTWQRDWLAVRPRSPWTISGVTHAPDTLLGTRLNAVLSDQVRFEVPAEQRALQGFFWCVGRLVLSVLDNLQPRFLILEPREEGWRCAELLGLPWNGVASVWPLDARPEESDGTLLAQAQDPITPIRLMLTDVCLVGPRRAEGVLRDIRRRRFGGDATRGNLGGRRAHSLHPDRASASACRAFPIIRRSKASSGSNAADDCCREHPWRRGSLAPPGMRPHDVSTSTFPTTISLPSPRTSCGVA